jgi:hypothetical protein
MCSCSYLFVCLLASLSNQPAADSLADCLVVRACRCKHYRRRCRIRAPCCNDVFHCRHCHNESTVCSALLCSVLPRSDSYHGHVSTSLSHPDISFDLCLPSTCCSWIGIRKTGTSSTAMQWNRCASSLSLFSVFCFTVRRVSFSYCANKLKQPFPRSLQVICLVCDTEQPVSFHSDCTFSPFCFLDHEFG